MTLRSRRSRCAAFLFAAACALTACRGDAPKPDAGGALTSQGKPDAASMGPKAVVAYARVAVREKPDDKSKAVTLLSYGERVTLLEAGEAFTKIQLSDGETGFAQSKHLLTGDVSDGTLLVEQDLYVRPDSLSPTRKRVPPGLFMFVLADKNGWRQVQLPDRQQGWVPRDKISTEEAELAAARAIHRGEVLVEAAKKPDAVRVLQDVLTAHPTSRLAPLLEARVTAWLPPDAGPPAPPASSSAAPAPVAPTPEEEDDPPPAPAAPPEEEP